LRQTPSRRQSLAQRVVGRVLRAPLDILLRRAMRTEGWTARDISIHVALVRGDQQAYAQRVANALEMIATYDPKRLARIQRDLSAILVWPMVTPGAVAQFYRDDRICALDSAGLIQTHAALIALRIVHEATHARLRSSAIGQDVWRHERICAKQELSFAERLPKSEALVELLWASVLRTAETDYSAVGNTTRAIATLEEAGVPLPVLRFLKRFANWVQVN
jgi:hypothetical protein